MPTLTSDPSASPRRYVPFCGRSGPRTRRPPSSGNGCGWALDRVVGWVGSGIAAVFFASLERCWCVNVRTQDDLLDLDDEQRDSEVPLVLHDGVSSSTAGGTSSAVSRKGGGGRSGKTKRNGGGFSCIGEI